MVGLTRNVFAINDTPVQRADHSLKLDIPVNQNRCSTDGNLATAFETTEKSSLRRDTKSRRFVIEGLTKICHAFIARSYLQCDRTLSDRRKHYIERYQLANSP